MRLPSISEVQDYVLTPLKHWKFEEYEGASPGLCQGVAVLGPLLSGLMAQHLPTTD